MHIVVKYLLMLKDTFTNKILECSPNLSPNTKCIVVTLLQTVNAWKFPGGLSDPGENVGE